MDAVITRIAMTVVVAVSALDNAYGRGADEGVLDCVYNCEERDGEGEGEGEGDGVEYNSTTISRLRFANSCSKYWRTATSSRFSRFLSDD
jgi:hypothetical protein